MLLAFTIVVCLVIEFLVHLLDGIEHEFLVIISEIAFWRNKSLMIIYIRLKDTETWIESAIICII